MYKQSTKSKKRKQIKLRRRSEFVQYLQDLIISKHVSNAGLISAPMHRLCNKFANDLEKLYLSEELQ